MWTCGQYVAGMLPLCGWYAASMWLVCCHYVDGILPVCGRYARARVIPPYSKCRTVVLKKSYRRALKGIRYELKLKIKVNFKLSIK